MENTKDISELLAKKDKALSKVKKEIEK